MRDAAIQSIAVGFFDGVHLGHQAILRGTSAAMTFSNHPLTVLSPAKAPRLIMSLEERLAAIKACGVDEVKVIDFTDEIAALSPAEFVRKYIVADKVICGENWRFGKDGLGDADFLRKCGIDVSVVPFAEYKGEKVSSSRIRLALEKGEMEDASAMLGRNFAINGRVMSGKGLGAKLGFPTVNLLPEGLELRLPLGVYEVEVFGARAIANFGVAPTAGDRAWKSPMLEIHFIDNRGTFAAEGGLVSAKIVRYIRPEQKFDSLEALRHQIASDCAQVQAF